MVVPAAPGWHVVVSEPTPLRAVSDGHDSDPSLSYSKVRVMTLQHWGSPCPPLYYRTSQEEPTSVEEHLQNMRVNTPFMQKLMTILTSESTPSREQGYPFMIPLDPREDEPTFLIEDVLGVYPPSAGSAEDVMVAIQERGKTSTQNYLEAKKLKAKEDKLKGESPTPA